MNADNNRTLMIARCLMLMLVSAHGQRVIANEWWSGSMTQNGFSEFAPPVSLTEPRDYSLPESRSYKQKSWRSGSSFNNENSVKYLPLRGKNPWKPVQSSRWSKSYSGKRPWGNVPERMQRPVTNMRLHDERFRQWSHQRDAGYSNGLMMDDPLGNYTSPAWLGMENYALPGGLFDGPLLTPAPLYSGALLNPWMSTAYPLMAYPMHGYPTNYAYPMTWQRPRMW